MILTLILPVKNEASILLAKKEYFKALAEIDQLRILFINDHSTDETEEVLEKFFDGCEVYQNEGKRIMGAFVTGAKRTDSSYCLLMPIDCTIDPLVFKDLIFQLKKNVLGFGYFEKKYDSSQYVYSIYCTIQKILTRFSSSFLVWTNCFILPTQVIREINLDVDFLDDLTLVKYLNAKTLNRNRVVFKSVKVSPRRYDEDGFLQRFLINLIIIFSYHFNVFSTSRLKRFYYSKKIKSLLN